MIRRARDMMRMSNYLIINQFGIEVSTGILHLFFGTTWESILGRIDHHSDGYVRSLFYEGQEYRVYRRLGPLRIVFKGRYPAKGDRASAKRAA